MSVGLRRTKTNVPSYVRHSLRGGRLSLFMECGGKRYPARRRFRAARGPESGAALRLSPHSKLTPHPLSAAQLQHKKIALW